MTYNLDQRIAEHNFDNNPQSYTSKRRPVTLKYFEEFQDEDSAFDFERQIKGWSRAKKEALIEENWDKIVELAKRKKK